MTLVYSEELSIAEIMLQVQKSRKFPIEVKIGKGTYHILNSEQATFFSLGIMAKIEADERNVFQKSDSAYEGLCNILTSFKRKDDKVPIDTLKILKRDCDIARGKEPE